MPEQKCIVCNCADLHLVLDLGTMPSANNLVNRSQLASVKYLPLKYYFCQNCSLFQQVDFSSSESLFSDYLYLTGVNKALVEHFRQMSTELAAMSKNKDLAFVIASNDGTEVLLLKDAGFRQAIGIEPSNVAARASKDITTINKFFTGDLGKELAKTYGKADLITANNVFAHIPDPKDMLEGMANLISDSGIISIEVHWLKSIVDGLEIETLYAEHYFVWTVKAMHHLTKQVGLKIREVIYMPEQHGGSLRFILAKNGAENLSLEESEKSSGLHDLQGMLSLQERADERKRKTLELVRGLKESGHSISIWTVPAKIPTMLNFCGITNNEIDYAYEAAQTKIGKFIPMANIEIKDEKLIMENMPNYLIVGAWNYINYYVYQKKKFDDYFERGGKLINLLTLEIIGGKHGQ